MLNRSPADEKNSIAYFDRADEEQVMYLFSGVAARINAAHL